MSCALSPSWGQYSELSLPVGERGDNLVQSPGRSPCIRTGSEVQQKPAGKTVCTVASGTTALSGPLCRKPKKYIHK